MPEFTLVIDTDNPVLVDKIKQAFDQVGFDLDDADGTPSGTFYDLEAALLDESGAVVWGTSYDGAQNNEIL